VKILKPLSCQIYPREQCSRRLWDHNQSLSLE